MVIPSNWVGNPSSLRQNGDLVGEPVPRKSGKYWFANWVPFRLCDPSLQSVGRRSSGMGDLMTFLVAYLLPSFKRRGQQSTSGPYGGGHQRHKLE